MADVEFDFDEDEDEDKDRQPMAEVDTEQEPLADDASLDSVLEQPPGERTRWIAEHPEQWEGLKAQARPHVRVAFDPKQLEALSSYASERPADRRKTIDRAVELLDAAHEPGGALELEPESLQAMKERVAGLTGRASVPTGDGEPGDLLQRGAIGEAQRDLAQLEAMVAAIESELLSVPWRPPSAMARREYRDRWGDLIVEEGGREVGRFTPEQLAERNRERAEEAAEGDVFSESGSVTIDDVRSWPRDKQLRFREEYPDEWESLKQGWGSISGIKKRKGTS